MIKNILNSPIDGAFALCFFIVVLVLVTTLYQSVDAQQLFPQLDDDTDALSNAVEALGGLKTLQDVKTQLIMAEGGRFEPGQKYEPIEQPLPVSSFRYNLTQDLNSGGLRMNWHRDVVYPYPNKLDYSVVIVNNTGFTYGKDGLFSPDRAPMRYSAINALLKEQLISSPLLLLQTAVKNPNIVQIHPDEMFRGSQHHVISLTPKENMPPIKIFFDNSTYLPSKVETIEDDPVHGDALIEVFFDDWRKVDGILFPFLVTHELHDEVIEERISLVDVNVNLPSITFAIPTGIQTSPNDAEEDSSRGWLASQWYLRMHAFGIPHYDINNFANFTEISSGVYHVTGTTHHSLVVEMNNHIVVVEPPLYEERSRAVIDEIAKRWPDKPITYVVATHGHDDHIGGLRTYAAKGAIVVTSEAGRHGVEEILNSSHTIRPDSFQMDTPKQVKIETVPDGEKMIMSDGNRSIHIYPVNNTHSDEMLAVYLPSEQILLNSDLFSPGSTPEPFRKYSKQLLEFVTNNELDVKTIAGTHGQLGTLKELEEFVNQK